MNQWTCVALVQSQSHVLFFTTPWTTAHQVSQSSVLAQVHDHWISDAFNVSLMPSNISFSVALFSFCLQSFPASESFPMSWLFPSGSQSTGASAWVSALPMNIQAWFPLRLTDMNSLLSKRLSRVFSGTTVWKHQFFGPQPSLWSNFHICTWLLEKWYLWL